MRVLTRRTSFPRHFPRHRLFIGAYRIKDKHGETAFDLLRDDDTEIRQLMRKARAQNSISHADIANGVWSYFWLRWRVPLTPMQTMTTMSLDQVQDLQTRTRTSTHSIRGRRGMEDNDELMSV